VHHCVYLQNCFVISWSRKTYFFLEKLVLTLLIQ
jgi:hypothetical protein